MSTRERLEKAQWALWYRALAWYSARRRARFSCMNWGYDDGRPLVAEHEPERYPLQLYHVLAEGEPIEGARLVDVSAGRGGGLSYLARTFAPADALGIDFVPAHVAIARRTAEAVGARARFQRGDAEALPLASASADVLLSVEASHCYASIQRFLGEAARVLRPGGSLLWADFATRARLAEHDAIAALSFELAEARDITGEVLRAMAEDGERRRRLIEASAPRVLWPLLVHFAAADESCETVERFREGRQVYFLRRLRRRP